jgi:predicted RNA-binding protein with PIN domain
MSLHYLLDGYNIIKQIPSLADKKLEDGRLGLIRWINMDRPHGSANNKITIVFDGNTEGFGMVDGGIASVVFSQYGSADDVIKHTIEDARDPKQYVVVTNDKDVYIYARSFGAKILSVQEFTKASKRSSSGTLKRDSKNISLRDQAQINKELSDLWLKDDKHS